MITSPLLTHMQGYLNGQWVGAASGRTMAVINPATGEKLADVPDMGARETAGAIEAADQALNNAVSIQTRRSWLRDIGDALLGHKDELGRIITLEQGKPRGEGTAEVEYTAGFFHFFADKLDHLKDKVLPGQERGCRWMVRHAPAGVACLITPWNYPPGTLAKKLAAALGAGCAVVAKPAELTPLSTMALVTIIERVGLDPGRFNVVLGQPEPIGQVFCSHPAVRVVSFTGSTRVGRQLIGQTAPHVKKLAMELGGNAPFIVFDDADLETAVDALMASKFRAGGQTCVCANRVYVHREVADRFLEMLAPKIASLIVGNGMDEKTDVGPLINREAWRKVDRHVRDALDKGAKRLVGETPPHADHDWGAFYPPTLLAGVTSEMLLSREETFGPVVGVCTFNDEEQVIHAANDTPYGLAAYVCTTDDHRAERVTRRLRFGLIGVNTGTGPSPHAPFGGMKQSGFGREGGVDGLMEFCDTQTVAIKQ